MAPIARTGDTPETTVHVPALPPLEAGDHLDQKTFHARYEAMPPDTRAELIGGMVYIPSPMKSPHGRAQRQVSRWLDEYEETTPGTNGADGATVILGDDSEPQPDAILVIDSDKGGQTRIDDNEYLHGPPELLVEVASSTESYDLHTKKTDYERAGVREYLVVALRQDKAFWFVLGDGCFQELAPGDDGIFRSSVFPGLWLDPNALFERNRQRLLAVLREGLASHEHAEFVKRLST